MTWQFLADVNHGVLLLCLALHCLLGMSFFWSLVQHLRYRRDALAEEARLLALPLPSDAELPDILVQLPTYNEGRLICRVAEAVGNLDWPKERLHVQVLDDSNDDGIADAEQAVATLRERGIDAVLLHRSNRAGFKAGALAEGLRRSRQEFVAILDADYVPRRDFLRACMRPLLHDRALALVQARCDYLNADENLVTYAQQRVLDAQLAIEQATRSWSGQMLPFNGTCGVWRRAAIDQAGGWQGDTLAEDLDLSYRAQLLGWHALFLVGVTVPGELPRTFTAWRLQQFRWTKGSSEVARKLLPAVWRSRLSLGRKLASSWHLSSGIFGPLFGLAIALAAVDLTVGVGLTWPAAALFLLSQIEVNLGAAALLLAGQVLARGARIGAELQRLPLVMWLYQYLALANQRAAIEAFLGHGTPFQRTPKRGTGQVDGGGRVKSVP